MRFTLALLTAFLLAVSLSSGSLLSTNTMASTKLSDRAQQAEALYKLQIDGLKGAKARLSKWRGKVVVANFWASWCGPCQYEMPRFQKWQQKYGQKGLQIVGIGLDKPGKLKNVARSLSIDYPLLVMPIEQGRPVLARLGNTQMLIPYTLIYNKDGSMAFAHKGLIGEDEFDMLIAPLLQ